MRVDARVNVLLRGFDQLRVPFEGCRAMLGPILVVYTEHLLLEIGPIDIGDIVGGPVGHLTRLVWRAIACEARVEDAVAVVFVAGFVFVLG